VACVGALVLGFAIGASGMASASKDAERDLADSKRAHQETRDELEAVEVELSSTELDLSDARSESTSLTDDLEVIGAEVVALRSKRPLPNLVGRMRSDVDSQAEEYGWEIEVASRETAVEEGTILEQSPSPGTQMKYGSRIQVTVAKPLPPGWRDIKVFSGSGETTTPEVKIPAGKVRILYSFAGNTNAQITMYRRPTRYIENYLNEIGAFSASTRIYYSGRFYFEICCGSWTVRIQEWR
jgi:hypothetical protein